MTRENLTYHEAQLRTLRCFGADFVLPSQWHDRVQQSAKPEEKLLWAMVQEALLCLQKYRTIHTPSGKRLFAEARDWFLSDDKDWPFSFINICLYLGLEPDYCQRGIRQLLDGGAPEPMKWKRHIAGMEESHRNNLSEALKRAWAEGRTKGKGTKKEQVAA